VGRFHVVDDKLVEIPEPLSEFEIKRRAQHAEWDKMPRIPMSRLDEAARFMGVLVQAYIERHPRLLDETAADTDRLVVKARVIGFAPEAYASAIKRLKTELRIAQDMVDPLSQNLMTFLAHFEAQATLQDKIYTRRDYKGPAPPPRPDYRQYLRQLDARLQEAECPPDLQEADEATESEIQQEQANG
jgi:hypothetical protein